MMTRELLVFDFENGTPHYSVEQVCQLCEISLERLTAFVEFGVLKPAGRGPQEWVFPPHALMQTRRAVRLQRDLELEMSGLALALDLLEEVAELRREIQHLRGQLACFVTPA